MRVLLYGDIDLNLIDGSAIWLTSIAEVLVRSGAEVLLVRRTPLTRDLLVRELLARPGVTFVDPWAPGHAHLADAIAPAARSRRRLQAEDAARVIDRVRRSTRVDRFLIRGVETAALLERESAVGPDLWVYVTDPARYAAGEPKAQLQALSARCAGVLCQTDEAREAIRPVLGPDARIVLLPPMIPAVGARERRAPDPRAPRLGYSGKLSPPYHILETLDAFARIRARVPGAEFHVIGDKIHNAPPVQGFEEAVRQRLRHTPGVIWHGGVSRAEAAALLDRVDVAISWRAPAFDDSLEMSTKVLEYGALGIPVLMNPSLVQRRVFGASHAGYVTSADEVVERFLALTSSADEYARASRAVRDVAARFTFDRVADGLAPLLREPARPAPRPLRLLVAGHDLKFLRPVLDALSRTGRIELLLDEYRGHTITDPARSAALLARADLVFCEWCLGNAEWYSRHVGDGQRLIVRLHLQERGLPYLDRLHWPRVDRLIFIAPRIMRECLETRPHLRDRSVLVYNPIPCDALDRPKLDGARFNLGLVGINPRRKAPHLAVDILERLRRRDSRYTLFVKSQPPWDHDWLWRQPDERAYYQALYDRVRSSSDAGAIVFDPPGPDVPAWLSKIGVVLSTSEFEGSHQAVAEGMASGALPAIRRWPGADELYPAEYGFDGADEAVELVARLTEEFEGRSPACRRYARERFDVGLIAAQYLRLFDEIQGGRPDADPAAEALGLHAGAQLRAVSG